MLSISNVAGRDLAMVLPCGPAAQRLVRRARCTPRHALRTTATAADFGPPASQLDHLLAGGKVTKTAVAKLAVADLRAECQRLGLPADGTKPALVDRVIQWAQGQLAAHANQPQVHAQPQQQQDVPAASPRTAPPPTPAAAAPQPAASPPPAAHSPPPPPSSAGPASAPPDVKVTWLGTSSGAPTGRRNVSSIAVRYGPDCLYLVDCGEGTRNQMRTAGMNPAAVSHIFITHMHGDHWFGVVGVLAAIGQARLGTPRQDEAVRIYGPPELHRVLLAATRAAQVQLVMPVEVCCWVLDPAAAAAPAPVDPAKRLRLGLRAPDQAASIPREAAQAWQAAYDGGSDQVVRRGLTWSVALPSGLRVTAAQLQHRMPCWGYVFQEPAAPAPPPPAADAGPAAGRGASFSGGGGAAMVRPGRKLVILGDTCDSSAIADVAWGCDLLSHEATYNQGMEEKAQIATHSTAEQAGAFAGSVRARALVLTHFSARYEQADKFKHRWVAAREQGMGITELTAGVGASLVEEAREWAKGALVLLANDFFTFTVPPRAPVSAAEAAAKTAAPVRRAAAPNAGGRGSHREERWELGAGRGGGGYRGRSRGGERMAPAQTGSR